MVCFPNTYVHTLKKKKNFFSQVHYQKNKGGAGDLVGEKRTFLGRQKFLADGVAEKSKNWPSANFAHIVPSTSRNLNSNQKQKSYINWKLCNAEKSKIMVAPPPFASEYPNLTGFSWDGNKLVCFCCTWLKKSDWWVSENYVTEKLGHVCIPM